jgi:tRNA threonylcarbamoyladenosine biosynthesis protein TsaB
MTRTGDQGGWLLAIDASTEQAGIALTNGDRVSELCWPAGREQTVSVIAEIDHLLALTGAAIAELAAIGVAIGPGMFNGLRVGLSLAKGLHVALGVPIYGVSTLEIVASGISAPGIDVVSVVPAGRGRVVWQITPGGSDPINGTIDEMAAILAMRPGPVVVAGDLTSAQADALRILPNVEMPRASARRRRPGTLAELAWARFMTGTADDPAGLAPVYLHAASASNSR